MTILLQHPITDKPKKPGEYWLQLGKRTMTKYSINQSLLNEWEEFLQSICDYWYEPIELPDDAIIVQ